MALNLFKKIFSFGSQPEEPKPAPEVPATPQPQPTPQPPPVPEVPQEPRPEPAQPVEPDPAPVEIPPAPGTPEGLPEPNPAPPEVPAYQPRPIPEVPLEVPAPPLPPAEQPLRDPKPAPSQPQPIPPTPTRTEPTMDAGPVSQGSDRVRVGRTVERPLADVAASTQAAARESWLQRLRGGLSRSSRELSDNLSGVFTKGELTDEIVEELEEVLIRADLGVPTAARVTTALTNARYGRQTTVSDIRRIMATEIETVLKPVALPLELDLSKKPHVILVVGVNGTGKTTTIGKLAAKLTAGGLKVMLAAGDTFRAAAIEQLKIWGERTGAPVVATRLGADAAGLAYEAFERAKNEGADVLLIDTAGRLQNKAELMAELEKVVRVLKKLDPEAPHTVLQTVDATTGQNAMNQVEIFGNVAGVSGLVMTKLDGSARGGILVAIAAKHRLPVYFIGVGEAVDDLEPFSAGDFARAIAGASA